MRSDTHRYRSKTRCVRERPVPLELCCLNCHLSLDLVAATMNALGSARSLLSRTRATRAVRVHKQSKRSFADAASTPTFKVRPLASIGGLYLALSC